MSRRTLLGPALWLLCATALVVGALTGLAVIGRFGPRPLAPLAVPTGIVAGTAVTLFLAVAAVTGQRRPAWGRVADALASTIAGVGMVVAIGSQELGWSVTGPFDPGAVGLGLAVAAPAVVVGAIFLVYARLNGWPTHQIIESPPPPSLRRSRPRRPGRC